MSTKELAVPVNEIAVIAEKMGVTPAKVQFLSETFSPFYFNAVAVIADAATVNVTSSDQVDEMRKAGQLRATLAEIRKSHEKTRKAVKDDALSECQAIDTIARHIRDMIEPVEARMKLEEDFARRERELLQAKMLDERTAKLQQFGVDTSEYNLATMSEHGFTELFEGLEAQFKARQKWQEEEDARLLKEETDRIHRENELAKENARLQKERDELQRKNDEAAAKAKAVKAAADAKLKAEKDKADAVLRAEQERSRKLQAEAEAARLAKEKEEWERAEAVRREELAKKQAAERAAQAPDREKILAFAAEIRALRVPAMASAKADKIAIDIKQQTEKFYKWVESKAGELS